MGAIPGPHPDDLCADAGPDSPRSHVAVELAGLLVAIDGWLVTHRKRRALRMLQKVVRLSPSLLTETALTLAVAAGFTLHKDGQEYGVFVGGKRVEPPDQSAVEDGDAALSPTDRLEAE